MINKKHSIIFSLAVVLVLIGVTFLNSRDDGHVDREQKESANVDSEKAEVTPRLPAALGTLQEQASAQRLKHLKRYGSRFRASSRGLALDFDLKTEILLRKPYEVSLRYRSAPAARYLPEMGVRVASINGFVIYRPPHSPLSIEEAVRFESNSFPVVRDANSGLIGLVSGRAIVKLRNTDFDIEGLLGGDKIYEATHLGVSYIKLPDGTDLGQAYALMQEHGEIERGDLEILQGGVVLK